MLVGWGMGVRCGVRWGVGMGVRWGVGRGWTIDYTIIYTQPTTHLSLIDADVLID